jgi:CMP-N,N'-diacetyllegionaminic acid synthase
MGRVRVRCGMNAVSALRADRAVVEDMCPERILPGGRLLGFLNSAILARMSVARRGVVAVIPARGASRGLPGKHLRLLAGRPVIAYTIDAALAARSIDEVLVSTDDAAIRAASIRLGASAPFLRPSELATDDSSTSPVIWHAVQWWEAAQAETLRVVVVLQPTSPLRTSSQIDAAVEQLDADDVDSVVSVAATPFPLSVLGMADGHVWHPLSPRTTDVRRQASPVVYRLTGGIYATRREALSPQSVLGDRVAALVVDPETAVDIDTDADLAAARRLFRQHRAS